MSLIPWTSCAPPSPGTVLVVSVVRTVPLGNLWSTNPLEASEHDGRVERVSPRIMAYPGTSLIETIPVVLRDSTNRRALPLLSLS